MSETKAITYTECREAFFVKKLKKAERGLDNLMRYGTDPDACVKSGEEVSFYRDALAALREQAALVHCIDCAHHSVPPKDSEGCIQFLYCNHPHQEKGDSPLIVDFTDFCSCGKRLEVKHDG